MGAERTPSAADFLVGDLVAAYSSRADSLGQLLFVGRVLEKAGGWVYVKPYTCGYQHYSRALAFRARELSHTIGTDRFAEVCATEHGEMEAWTDFLEWRANNEH